MPDPSAHEAEIEIEDDSCGCYSFPDMSPQGETDDGEEVDFEETDSGNNR